jgi:uncharacterized SAM-binding protein YcdF (DUF218 family)
MSLRYLLKQLILPPGGLLLLLLLGWWLRRRAPKLSALCLVTGFAGLWLMSLPITVEWTSKLIERDAALMPGEWAQLARRADAIVIIGAGRGWNDPAWGGVDQPSPLAMERMRYAARLAKASGLPVLASGGVPHGEAFSEADMMADSLVADFVQPVRWREARSRTTWENALYSAQILRAEGVERVVLVTQAWHMSRARWCFEQAGLQVVAAPVGFLGVPNGRPFGGWLPESLAFWQSSLLLNEAAGLLLYPLAYRSR